MHYFIHLLNDFSGSPRIINEKIACYAQLGCECFVITSGDQGLIRLEGRAHRVVPYAKHSNRAIWVLRLLTWHLRTFLFLLMRVRKGDVVHCSTLLTAPHLLAARLHGAMGVSHIMETRVSPAVHKRAMLWLVSSFAAKVVYLSAYVEFALGPAFEGKPSRITYPCIDRQILDAATVHAAAARAPRRFSVGLICSLVWHKGYVEFIRLAGACPECDFILVVNGRPEDFHRQFNPDDLPGNLRCHFQLKNVSLALAEMDVLLSLTKREGWIETFGLTLIEAMAFGLPVIAPDVGAPPEFIEDGVNGHLVNESDLNHIAVLLRRMKDDRTRYAQMCRAARATALRFTPAQFAESVRAELQWVQDGAGLV